MRDENIGANLIKYSNLLLIFDMQTQTYGKHLKPRLLP